MDGKSFKQQLAEEKEKLGKMDGRQRWDYFKTYYLLPLIIIIIVAAFVIYCIVNFIAGGEEIDFEGAVVNLPAEEETQTILTTAFAESLGLKNVELETDMNITFDLEDTDQYAYANRLKLMSQVAAGELDYMLMNEEVYENLKDEEMFTDISSYSGSFKTVDGIAFVLTGTEVAEALGYEEDQPLYLAFMVSGKGGETYSDENIAGEFIDYLGNL